MHEYICVHATFQKSTSCLRCALRGCFPFWVMASLGQFHSSSCYLFFGSASPLIHMITCSHVPYLVQKPPSSHHSHWLVPPSSPLVFHTQKFLFLCFVWIHDLPHEVLETCTRTRMGNYILSLRKSLQC